MDPTAGVGRDRPFVLCLALLMASAVLLVWIATSRYGVGISADSVGYLSVAYSLRSGHGFRTFDGRPYLDQPPGFPLLLAGCGLLGLAPAVAARLVNALALGAIVGLTGITLRRLVPRRWAAGLGAWTVAVSLPLHEAASYAWTEPLFILCVLGFCERMTRFLAAGEWSALAAAALCAAMACLLRYIGLAVVLTGVIALLCGSVRERGGQRCWAAAGFAVAAILPLAAWCLRNWLLSATLFGERIPSTFTGKQLLTFTADTVVRWLAIPGVGSGLPIGPLAALLLLVAGCGLYRLAVGDLDPTSRVMLHLMAGFTVSYLGWLLVSAKSVAFDRIGDRLLSPVFVPLVILGVFTLDQGRRVTARPGAARWLMTAGLAGVSLGLVFPTHEALRRTRAMAADGAGGYATARWQESPLLQRLRREPLPGLVYSNRPDALYLLTGTAARLSPQHSYHNNLACRNRTSLPQFERDMEAAGTASLVWFPHATLPFLFRVEELPASLEITPRATFPDGTLYNMRVR